MAERIFSNFDKNRKSVKSYVQLVQMQFVRISAGEILHNVLILVNSYVSREFQIASKIIHIKSVYLAHLLQSLNLQTRMKLGNALFDQFVVFVANGLDVIVELSLKKANIRLRQFFRYYGNASML
jgi:hypothetical protein